VRKCSNILCSMSSKLLLVSAWISSFDTLQKERTHIFVRAKTHVRQVKRLDHIFLPIQCLFIVIVPPRKRDFKKSIFRAGETHKNPHVLGLLSPDPPPPHGIQFTFLETAICPIPRGSSRIRIRTGDPRILNLTPAFPVT
jgi:hypothetical protein